MPSYSDGDWRYNVNDTFATNSEKFVSMANTLLAAGWTIVDRSDATSVFVGGQNSAANWNASNAWERYRQPGGQRDYTVQRGTTDRSVRGYLGRAGILFTGGTPTVVPTDATALQVIGTVTNFNTIFFGATSANEYCHFAAKAVADGLTANFYPLYMMVRSIGSPGNDVTNVYLDSVTSPAGVLDVEPWVGFPTVQANAYFGWYLAGLGGAAQATNITRQNVTSWNGQNLYASPPADDLCPLFGVSSTGPAQRKGQLDNYVQGSSLRAAGDTFNLGTVGAAKINWTSGGVTIALPWPSGVTPLL